MSRLLSVLLAALVVVAVASPDAGAISRVSRSLNFLEVFGGPVSPVGEIEFFNLADGVGDFDADEAFESSYSLGIGLGQVRAGHLGWTADFRYTKHEPQERFENRDYIVTVADGLTLNSYDIDLNVNYYLTDVARSVFSPYVGLGVAAGIMSAGYENDDFDNESELKALAGLNFGFDVRLWAGPDGSQVSLVSLNRYDLIATEERPRYLNIGVGLRYYIRP